MNLRKIFLTLLILLSFLGMGITLSNIQSQEADQLLETHGLSNNTRYFYTDKKTTIRSFLKYLHKNFKNSQIQVHFNNRYEKDQVLVWANKSIVAQPTDNGRYFTMDDFNSMVTVAVLGPDSNINTTTSQNNKYIIYDNRYYSVIGTFKRYKQIDQYRYYMTTGINQENSTDSLANYRVSIDASARVLKAVSKHYKVSLKYPGFVIRHKSRKYSIIQELILIVLLSLVGIIGNVIIAMLHWKQAKLTRLRGDLLRNWLINRSSRYLLVELLLMLGSYFILVWKAFFERPEYLIALLSLNLVILIISYMTTIFVMKRKEK
ncbi:hypothetical protein FC52_GL000247 [Lactobacillus pasteurii DSM 23907 = CRBIP 24.76]|uniref:MacB-like periplasmic core domain-containing protein n=1 Tax=Lactobacillus pasteurii DSM 23907 = CRBIP 24.76 TaxID=1423790 RepID=I7LE91_9LACO|nr:hypothetical protein [Lactobacillus pasteurii]KRK08549.1 hypothetical protein FC52_GL000247 [Lactobacillus pasteurii DSM 23907 = CRBIP 24.76]TDG75728.1 hypothetical protein C5L33_000613 [Lactobacillus pasteurii]CCI85588.1 Putative uncharacterized protein [Lactobacillus pasteurii DSM 23907 = CRBIP 24.76]